MGQNGQFHSIQDTVVSCIEWNWYCACVRLVNSRHAACTIWPLAHCTCRSLSLSKSRPWRDTDNECWHSQPPTLLGL